MLSVPFIFFFVWLAGLVLAIWSAEVARLFAKRMGRAARRPVGYAYQPRVAVILPIKGVDEDTAENLRALLQQDYDHARFLFAVEAEDDPVVTLLEQHAREDAAGRIEIVVAGIATNRGQKVHNQLAAIERTTDRDEILVFMDADACPKPTWLRALIGPLESADVTAATGFRFYVPAGPHSANAIVSVINASVAALLGPARRNFLWGGSMAVRRADFFRLGVHDAWQNALSDDYVMSYCVKHNGPGRIHFVQHCLVASTANFNWGSFFEFACRQYRITRVCAPHVWLAAFSGAILYLLAFGYIPLLYAHGLLQRQPDHRLLVMLAALYLVNVFRGYCLYFGGKWGLPEHAPTLSRIRFWYTWGFPLTVLINFVALLGSAIGRNIVWRGVTYTMYSRTRTRVHRPILPDHPLPATPPREFAETVRTGDGR